MKAGYVISGIVLISLATVFAFVAGLMAVIVYFNNLASTAGSNAILFAGDYLNALIVAISVGTLFYIGGAIFLWQGFKTTPTSPVYYPLRYPPSPAYSSQAQPYGSQYPSAQRATNAPASQYVTSPNNPVQSPTSIQQASVSPSTIPSGPSSSKVFANCPKCNARIPAEVKFCPSCGTDLRPKSPVDPAIHP